MNATWKKRAALITFFTVLAAIIWWLFARTIKPSSSVDAPQKIEITVKVKCCECGGHHHTTRHPARAKPPVVKKTSAAPQAAPQPVQAKVEPEVVIIERTRTRVIHEEEPVENEYRRAQPRVVYNNNDDYYPPPPPRYHYYYTPSEPQYYSCPPRYNHYAEPPHVWGGGGRVWNSPRPYGGPQNPPLGGGSYGGPRNPPTGGSYGGGGGPRNPPVGARGGSGNFGRR